MSVGKMIGKVANVAVVSEGHVEADREEMPGLL